MPQKKTRQDLLIERLNQALRTGPKRSIELMQALQLSQPSFSLLWNHANPLELRRFGGNKNARYAKLKHLGGLDAEQPVYKILPDGSEQALGKISAVFDRGFIFEGERAVEVFQGLPYFFEDLRPQGYLGKSFASRHADLHLPHRTQDWTDEQIWASIVRRGEDLPGNLIIGKESMASWLERKHRKAPPLDPQKGSLDAFYGTLADQSESGETGASSAAGEQPKFLHQNKLVKFSPSLETPFGQRWGDLLLAEFHALQTLQRFGFSVPAHRYIKGAERVFLEVERFDRTAGFPQGRRGVLSFRSLSLKEGLGLSNWSEDILLLERLRKVSRKTAHLVLLLEAFGMLIANTDRHHGNLSFFWELAESRKKLELAPVYDMLPMAFAPSASGVIPRLDRWSAPEPTPDVLPVWKQAREMALGFWTSVANDDRFSTEFLQAAERVSGSLKKA